MFGKNPLQTPPPPPNTFLLCHIVDGWMDGWMDPNESRRDDGLVWFGLVAACLSTESLDRATVNQHPPVHCEGWMISGHETVFCWVPVP
jgi:hypothetical protein